MVVLLLGPALLEELGCNVELNVEFGPSDAGGFGTTLNAERESSRPPYYLVTPLMKERGIFVRYIFILECLIKGKVDQISFVLSSW